MRTMDALKLMNLTGDAKVASIAKVRESSVKTEEDTLKSLEEERKKEES